MHDREKSDTVIVAAKPTNKAGQPAAEPVEPRAGAEGNASQQSTLRTQGRERVTQALERVRQAAKLRKKEKFTALLHHVNVDLLRESFFALERKAAPGVDGLTWQSYAADLDRNLTDLHARVHRGAYRPLPSRRTYIPKSDGKQRPLAVAAIEDKIVQRATAAVLNAIYEEAFLGFSYGFRPKRGQHDALDALIVGITAQRVNFILDADVASFFDSVSQCWLVRLLEHRIGDPRIIRLIRKWLKAGVLEDGVVTTNDKGTGQGSVISPLLANAYLHYVFDLWAERWRQHEATGDMILMRYADDIVVGFEHEAGLRGIGADDVDVKRMQRPTKLGHAIAAGRILPVDPKDRELVGIEGDRPPVAHYIALGLAQIIKRRLRGHESRVHQPAGRVVDVGDEAATLCTPLEPVVVRAVNLDQFSDPAAAVARLMHRRQTPASVKPQTVLDHPLAQGLARHAAFVELRKLLASQRRPEIAIAFPDNRNRQFTSPSRQPVVARLAAPRRHQSNRATIAQTSQKPKHLPPLEPQ